MPGIRVGLLTAVLIVFIPALGSYAIPEIVGGTSSEMIGNKIAKKIFTERNLPHASALSALLALAVFLPLLLAAWARRRSLRGSTETSTGGQLP
jgi:spermidine/putrescine transport system permease protein